MSSLEDDEYGIETGENTSLLEKNFDDPNVLPLSQKDAEKYLDIYRYNQLGIICSYFNIGVANNILVSPIAYYLIHELKCSSSIYSIYVTLMTFPWSFQVIFGLLIDAIPILGFRRKPWLLIGWIAYIAILLRLYFTQQPSILNTIFSLFIASLAFQLCDVATDTLVVERSKYETIEKCGMFQTNGFMFQGIGMVVGSILGMLLYNKDIWNWGFTINEIFLLALCFPVISFIPSVFFLEEIPTIKKFPTIEENVIIMYQLLQKECVYKPMYFLYIFYIFQIPNASWDNFLIVGLNFTDFDLGLLKLTSAILYFLGIVVFKLYLFDMSWRKVFICTTFVGILFSIAQVILILRLNTILGIPDMVFALGDSTIGSLLFAIQAMPTSIMFILLVPKGSEGLSYALFTTIANLSWTVANDIGSRLTTVFHVSNNDLSHGNFNGILKLSILTSVLQVLPLIFIRMIPNNKEDQKLQIQESRSYPLAGMGLIIIVIMSFMLTIGINFTYLLIST